MFMFDVETLGVESNAVVLSAALVYFDPEEKPSYQKMLDGACFVKFKAKEQGEMGRTVTLSTLEWWKTQHEYVRKVSLEPSAYDLTAVEGMNVLCEYMSKYPNAQKQTMWARGSLDQLVIDSLATKLGMDPLTGYAQWRDVRTAVDILYGTSNGYCGVEHPEFERASVIKHHPVHDCAYDAMMLMYGKN